MTRRSQRENLFKLLFRVEFYAPEDLKEQETLFLEELRQDSVREDTALQIADKFERILERLPEIDESLGSRTEHWTTDRIGKAELTILRIAVYEILYDEDVPTGVAINEAVELAKKFGQDASYGFVNAVLAKFA